MDGDSIARLIWLGLLGTAVAGWLFVESRGRMGQALRQGLAWLLIIVGLVGAWGLWQDYGLSSQRQAVVAQGGEIVIPRGSDDHFYLRLDIDGTPLRFMVDTGASSIVLSDRDADRLGIDRRNLAWLGQARTANGTIRTARVTLQNVSLGAASFGDLLAWVGEGRLDVSLLGMEFLNRFARVEMARDRLVLTP